MRRRQWLEAPANLGLSVSALVAAVAIAWWAHSAVSFGYPLLYDALAIDEHIAEYAPQNEYRDGFARTSRAKRLALFGALVAAINQGGEGLEALSYRPSLTSGPIPLLRPAEVKHLRAVAGLVSALTVAGVAALIGFAGTLITMRWRGVRLSTSAPLLGLAAALGVGLLIAIVALDTGEDSWFAWAHEQLFGAGHQWFFYYQESLMTTLLKAPDLFLPLAVSMSLVVLLATALLYLIARWVLPRR